MKTRILFLFIALSLTSLVRAQTDTLFWFAVPYATPGHVGPNTFDTYATINLTATDTVNITTVIITQYLNPSPFFPITVTIDPAISLTKSVSFTEAQMLQFSDRTYGSTLAKSNSALLIRANHDITSYYEINKKDYNPAIFSLKGQNALGDNFWIPFQNKWDNASAPTPSAFSQIVIVATENNTPVRITLPPGKAAQGFAAGSTINITLNKGQTFMLVPPETAAGIPNRSAAAHLAGTHVQSLSSDKPISVSLGDDSVYKNGDYDYIGDQHVPVLNANNKSVIGHEYIVMRGQTSNNSGGSNEKIYILGTVDNTTVTVKHKNGTIITFTGASDVDAGEQVEVNVLPNSGYDWTYINASQLVYVLHISGFGNELGEAILPTIDGCTGSLSVSFTRSKTDPFYLNLMTKQNAIDNFYITKNGVTTKFLDASQFEAVGTSDWWVLKNIETLMPESDIPTDKVVRITNTKNVFHLGYFNGKSSGGGCVYGYFSDYNELEASANVEDQGNLYTICGVDSLQLKAEGGLSYLWSPSAYLNDSTLQNPILYIPEGGFKDQGFDVLVQRPCYGDTTLHIVVTVPPSPTPFLTLDYTQGCAPLSIHLKDASLGADRWRYDPGNGTMGPVVFIPPDEQLTFQNTTNTIVKHIISYTVGNNLGCWDAMYDTITVFPEILSEFELSDWNDTTICSGTSITFNNLSTGNTANFEWFFGDGSTSSDTLSVSHIYTNYSHKDTVYHAYLVAISPYGCNDTSRVAIRVYPYIFTSFTIDSSTVCSPVNMYINPLVSVGVDTFHWAIYDVTKTFHNNAFLKNDELPFSYPYSNLKSFPDTVNIEMFGVNHYGCSDTSTVRQIIIYPRVVADFTMDHGAVCDSIGVTLTNNSTGYDLVYNWDFGNGTSIFDTSGLPLTRYFLNRGAADSAYIIRLTAASTNYFCQSSFYDTLIVHPFIRANFAIDYSNNCSPLKVQIINNSIGGNLYNWDLGNGYTYNTFIPDTNNYTYSNNTNKDTTYYIKLVSTNTQGCTDTMQHPIFIYSQVVAAFDFTTPVTGCNPVNVGFANNSTGQNLNYVWSFGNSTFSTDLVPLPRQFTNITAKDTTYHVRLTATNTAGCDSSIVKDVKVYSHVTADFSIERIDSCSPFKIRIDNFSVGGITDFVWQYTLNDSIKLNTFTDPDIPVYHNTGLVPITHPVVLKTRNIHGCQAERHDSITVYPEMFASFHPDTTMGCQPLTIAFTNNSNIKGGTFFMWDFDDGKYSYLEQPSDHIYSNKTDLPLLHNVHLEATTQFGCYDDTLIAVSVHPYIYAKYTIDRPEICSDEFFTIDRTSSSGAISQYKWDFQDNGIIDEIKSDPVFDYTYPNHGSANTTSKIRLTVMNNEGCDTSWVDSIMIHPQVRAAFTIDNPVVCHPIPTSFINSSAPAIPLTYYWDFGDGSNSTDPNPVHPYKNFSHTDDKPFTIHLTATSEYGCDSTVSNSITIHPKPLSDFSYPHVVDCPPFPVQFTNQSVGTHLAYFWDFDNGNTSLLENPEETFGNTSATLLENEIRLIVTTDYNCTDTAMKPIQIYPGVEVDFDASSWNGCSPMQINLDGTATNENEYYWYVDGKVVSNYEDPSYRFSNESTIDKTFDVRFRAVSINGCTDDTTKQVIVYPQPLAEFLPSPQSQNYNTETDITSVTFNNQTNNQSLWNYKWDFGDGTNSTQSAASFLKNYTIWGDIHNDSRIPVKLIATNINHSICTDTSLHYIIINPPLPKVDLGPNVSGCMPLTVNFPSTTKYSYSDSYQWDFGYEGETSVENTPPSLVYDTAGTYIIRLSVSGDGGSNWDYKTVTVYPKPGANYTFAPDSAWVGSQTEAGTPIKFFNLSGSGMSYFWDFDDGQNSYEYQPQHEYDAIGKYFITLRVENTYGCLDTFKSETPVIIYARGVLQFPNAITIYVDDPANEYYDPEEADPRIFRPYSSGVEKYKLEIYNRWGELIFESNDVNKGWNGFIKGVPVKQDVYVWRVRATFSNGRPVIKAGDVTVLVKQP